MKMGYDLRKGMQAIVYKKEGSEKKFLIMHRIKNWTGWEFPKGGIKQGETYADAVVRELEEECGITKENIMKMWETHHDFMIKYPEVMWEKTGYRGALNRNFIIEVNPDAMITIKHNDELEHDDFKWIPEEDAAKLLDPRLVRSLMFCNKILENYNKATEYGIRIKKKFAKRFIGFLLYGSRTTGRNKEKSDYDIVVILDEAKAGDIESIKALNKGGLNSDLQLTYAKELPSDADFISWDSSGPFYYFVISSAITIIGKNPFDLVKPPDEKAILISTLSKMQYYIYRIRQIMLGSSKNNTNALYFTKCIPPIMRMIIELQGKWYGDEFDAMEDFNYMFPNVFSDEEIKKMQMAIENDKPLEMNEVYSIYTKLYHTSINFLKNKIHLGTLDEISTKR